LDLNRKRHVRGIEIKGASGTFRAKVRTLNVKVKGKGAKRLSIRVGDGGLVVPSGKVRKPFKLVVKDVEGAKTKLSLRAK
jgi:hypothetical protein